MKATTEKGYREKIRKQCLALGTYKPEFEDVIMRLAEYRMRQRQLRDLYRQHGSAPIVSAPGSSIAVKNPILEEMDRVDKLALELERELGMTPAALRKLNEAALARQEADPLAAALSAMRGS